MTYTSSPELQAGFAHRNLDHMGMVQTNPGGMLGGRFRLSGLTNSIYLSRLRQVKRRQLLKQIREAARSRQLALDELREGAQHSIFQVGDFSFAVPRHTEINEHTAQGIMKNLEDQLGKDWWRR